MINEHAIRRIIKEELEYAEKYAIIAKLQKDGYLVSCNDSGKPFFDPSKIKGGNRAEIGYGMYFSDEPYKPISYGETILYTPKNIYRFLDLDDSTNASDINTVLHGIDDDKAYLSRLKDQLGNVRTNREYEAISIEIEELESKIEENERRINGEILVLLKYEMRRNRTMEKAFKEVLNTFPGQGQKISDTILSLGYDGTKLGNQYCIFNYEKLNNNLKMYE